MTIRGKEFGKGGMEVVRDKGGNDVLIAIRNDKKVAGACGCEVIPPAGTGKDTRLGAIGTWSAFFSVSIHSFSL